MDVRAHVNNGISIMFDRAKLALKARTPLFHQYGKLSLSSEKCLFLSAKAIFLHLEFLQQLQQTQISLAGPL